jgi:predicted signal transduction protein with EAL and GGDEF domain
MDRLFTSLEKRGSLFWTIAGITLVGLLGIVDYLTGYEISFSLSYLAPIALVTSYVSLQLGLMISILSAVTWLAAELEAGKEYTHTIFYLWNTLIRFGFFIIITYLISELRKMHQAQRILASTDYVSGAMNARSFNELVEMEIDRSRRYQHPFTVAYIDLDNFKP